MDMETTFDKFINRNHKRKAKFEKEYNEFLLSEFVLEKMESENIFEQINVLPFAAERGKQWLE